jgi:hypothetical protein
LKPGVDYNPNMIRTVEAIVDEKGQVRLSEPLQLSRSQRALVTILDEEPSPQLHEDSLLSERALAEDWNRPEEDAATRIKSPGRTTPPGLPGRNSWRGWGRSFRSSARRVAATSG